ncbi:MAG: DUF1223 domain-containing protein [Thiobacillus sp.]
MRACILLCALLTPAVHAATCTATSGATHHSLLELYTSEGCSSCPPADRWLSQLPEDANVVPLAFHVDYWDRLGWKDPYAQAAFSQRQRARNSGPGWIYTPQFMLDGKDFRGWRRGLKPAPPASIAAVELMLTITQTPQYLEAKAESRPRAPDGGRAGQLFLALTENKLSSTVTAGENARRTLRHDHVVRELAGPFDASRAHYRFALQPGWKAADLGVAAFITNARGDPLQALAQPACP